MACDMLTHRLSSCDDILLNRGDKTRLQSLLGIILAGIEYQIGRFRQSDNPWQEPRQPQVTPGNAQFDKWCRKNGLGGGQTNIAGCRKRHTCTNRVAVDRCNGWLGDTRQCADKVCAIT